MIKFEVNQQVGKKIPLKLWQKWIAKMEKILKVRKKIEISVGIVGEAAIKKLNKDYRHKNQVTDVLSFGEIDRPIDVDLSAKGYLGEIIICYPQAVRQAKKVSHSVNQEIEWLLIHGFLHLLGHDHEKSKEAEVMRSIEREIMSIK